MHDRRTRARALFLVEHGWSDARIARATGVARSTVRAWRVSGPPSPSGRRRGRPGCPRCDRRELDEAAYAYLLGLYLGDGYINREPRTYRLRIYQDRRYADLIGLCRCTIARVRGCRPDDVGIVHGRGCVAVSAYWNHWPCVFPQHGRGRKHSRPIELRTWQADITSRYPKQLLRGLIHSDGCRVSNRVGPYSYPRYFFTDRSTDILRLFRETCATSGIPFRLTNPTTISIAHRDGVSALDRFIGPKS